MSDTNNTLSTDAVDEEVLEIELEPEAEQALAQVTPDQALKHPTVPGTLRYDAKRKEFGLHFAAADFWGRLHPSAVKTVPALYDKEGRIVSQPKVTGGKVLVASITVPPVMLGDRGRVGGILNMTVRPVAKTAPPKAR